MLGDGDGETDAGALSSSLVHRMDSWSRSTGWMHRDLYCAVGSNREENRNRESKHTMWERDVDRFVYTGPDREMLRYVNTRVAVSGEMQATHAPKLTGSEQMEGRGRTAIRWKGEINNCYAIGGDCGKRGLEGRGIGGEREDGKG